MSAAAQQEMVFYVPGSLWLVDFARLSDGQYLPSLEAMQANFPGCELMSYDEASQAMNDAAKQPVTRITREEYDDKLCVMPPLDWRGSESGESFKLCEMYSGNITDIYARSGNEYFTLRDHVTLTHGDIMQRVKEVQGKETQE